MAIQKNSEDARRGRIRISGSPTLNTKQAAEVAEREHIIRVLSPSPPGKQRRRCPLSEVRRRGLVVHVPQLGREPAQHGRGEGDPLAAAPEAHAGPPNSGQDPGEVVGKLVARLRDESKLKPKTVKNILGTLRRILASAVEWEYLAALPVLLE